MELATGKTAKLTEHSGERIYLANDLSPDGRQIHVTSNAGNGYDNVGLLDIASKTIDWLTQDKWEISAGTFSPNGKLLTWTANIDGNTDILLYDIAGKRSKALPLRKGVNALGGAGSAFTRDGTKLLFYH